MSETTEKPRRRLPWLKITLFVSLAVNLLIVGLVAGAVMGGKSKERGQSFRNLGYGPFMQALPLRDRRAIGSAMKEREGSFRENRAKFRSEFDAFLVVLRTDPLEPEKLKSVVEAQRVRIGERLALGQELLIAQIIAMDSATRAAYADELDELFKRRPKGPPKRD